MLLPAPARAVRQATLDSVAAAREQDAGAFEEATDRLAACEPEHVRVVLGAAVRHMLEDLHPDGLSSDDLLDLIKACARRAFAWYPDLDVNALVVVLTGALGIHEPDQEPRRWTPLEVARHAPLFIRELAPKKPLEQYLDQAFTELEQHERNELP